ncbi:MAG: SDR family NAD(P)-dependent oxidoreductase [Legionella sp.]
MFLITGGGSGIGRALALALANRQKQVLVVGRDSQRLAATAACSAQITALCADVATSEGRELIVAHLAAIPQLQGLIHNAGLITPITPIHHMTCDAWRQVMATNLEAPLFLTQQLLAKLNGSRVLHIGSGAAYFPVTGWSAYCVSKAALSMLTRCWQLEMNGLYFASVMPGIVDTPMQANIRQSHHMDADKRNFFKRLQQDKQLLHVETVASFLVWLLLDISVDDYAAKEWDIYHTEHHRHWLVPPHEVPIWKD